MNMHFVHFLSTFLWNNNDRSFFDWCLLEGNKRNGVNLLSQLAKFCNVNEGGTSNVKSGAFLITFLTRPLLLLCGPLKYRVVQASNTIFNNSLLKKIEYIHLFPSSDVYIKNPENKKMALIHSRVPSISSSWWCHHQASSAVSLNGSKTLTRVISLNPTRVIILDLHSLFVKEN